MNATNDRQGIRRSPPQIESVDGMVMLGLELRHADLSEHFELIAKGQPLALLTVCLEGAE